MCTKHVAPMWPWFKHINSILNLNPCMSDTCVCLNAFKDLIITVYVYDILTFGMKIAIYTFKTSIKEKLNVRMLLGY